MHRNWDGGEYCKHLQLEGLMQLASLEEMLDYHPIMAEQPSSTFKTELGTSPVLDMRKRKIQNVIQDTMDVVSVVQPEKKKEKRVKSESCVETTTSSARCASMATTEELLKASDVVRKPDYVHVRARRGQATDSHSLAERARREKISERMRYLQDLVPGCNKIIGKAGMLDEIINYVQSLQRQIEFLSMKLAASNPVIDLGALEFSINAKESMMSIAPDSHGAMIPSGGLGLTLNLQDETVTQLADFSMSSFNVGGGGSSPAWFDGNLESVLAVNFGLPCAAASMEAAALYQGGR